MSRANDPTSARSLLRNLPRAVDALPIWAQLNITWKCNLDCGYCSEYDNSKGHVPTDVAIQRIDKCKELGCVHTDLIGGEPLLHPDVLKLMQHVIAQGMTTGMTTNGFLLTERRLAELVDAGIGRIQISVDAVTPTATTQKSLKTLRKKIEMVAKSNVWFRVNAVICEETLEDVEELGQFCFDLGVGINYSVAHTRGRLVPGPNDARVLEKLRWLRERKHEGRAVHTPYYLIDYYERALEGRPLDWTCLGGQKAFYVSPDGDFHYCYHTPGNGPFLDVTREQIARNGGKKGCETGCGVDCVIHTSLPYSNLAEVAVVEARERLTQLAVKVGGRRFLPAAAEPVAPEQAPAPRRRLPLVPDEVRTPD
jgi:MoaA/NifB/PqqE/SkfB family radical SAM enzyme